VFAFDPRHCDVAVRVGHFLAGVLALLGDAALGLPFLLGRCLE